MSLGETFGQNTVLRFVNAECKMLFLFASMLFYGLLPYDSNTGIFVWEYYLMLGSLAVIFALFCYTHIPYKQTLQVVKLVAFWTILLIVMESFIGSLQHALFTATRLALLMMIASWITYITPFSEMIRVFEYPAQLLRPFGVSHQKVAFCCALVLRLIPCGLAMFESLKESAHSRGMQGFHCFIFVSWIVAMLKMAHELSDALDSRGFSL